MHQSTTPSLSQTIWLRWASRHFITLPIVQTLLPVTFGYSLSSEAVVMRQLRRWKRPWRRSLTCSHKRTSMGPSRSCWNGKCIAAGGDYFEDDCSFMSVLSIKVPIRKNSGNLLDAPCIYVCIYIYIHAYTHTHTHTHTHTYIYIYIFTNVYAEIIRWITCLTAIGIKFTNHCRHWHWVTALRHPNG